jgi:serine/threonine-protein kinase
VLLGIDFAIAVGVQLLDGVAALHAADGIHRELRTDHVTVSSDGTVRIIDFGSAQCTGVPAFHRYHRVISPPLFRNGGFRFRYMSPEQVLGRELDARTDVFSAAGLICELVTNRHPLGGATNDMDALIRVREGNVEVPQSLPASLRLAIQMAASRERRQRSTAAAFRDTLRAAAQMARIDIGPHVIARRLVELGVPT